MPETADQRVVKPLIQQLRDEILAQLAADDVIDFVVRGNDFNEIIVAATESAGDPQSFFVLSISPAKIEVSS